MISAATACGGNGVNLVKEDYAGCGGPGLAEDLADGALGFADVHADELGAFDGDKVKACFRGDGFGGEGFGTARRPVQQNPLLRFKV